MLERPRLGDTLKRVRETGVLPGFALEPVASVQLELPTLEAAFDHPPTRWLTYPISVDIYRAGPGSG